MANEVSPVIYESLLTEEEEKKYIENFIKNKSFEEFYKVIDGDDSIVDQWSEALEGGNDCYKHVYKIFGYALCITMELMDVLGILDEKLGFMNKSYSTELSYIIEKAKYFHGDDIKVSDEMFCHIMKNLDVKSTDYLYKSAKTLEKFLGESLISVGL